MREERREEREERREKSAERSEKREERREKREERRDAKKGPRKTQRFCIGTSVLLQKRRVFSGPAEDRGAGGEGDINFVDWR